MPAMKNLVLLVNKKWNKVDLLTERMMMRTGNEGIKTSEPDHTVLSTGLIIGYIHLKLTYWSGLEPFVKSRPFATV